MLKIQIPQDTGVLRVSMSMWIAETWNRFRQNLLSGLTNLVGTVKERRQCPATVLGVVPVGEVADCRHCGVGRRPTRQFGTCRPNATRPDRLHCDEVPRRLWDWHRASRMPSGAAFPQGPRRSRRAEVARVHARGTGQHGPCRRRNPPHFKGSKGSRRTREAEAEPGRERDRALAEIPPQRGAGGQGADMDSSSTSMPPARAGRSVRMHSGRSGWQASPQSAPGRGIEGELGAGGSDPACGGHTDPAREHHTNHPGIERVNLAPIVS